MSMSTARVVTLLRALPSMVAKEKDVADVAQPFGESLSPIAHRISALVVSVFAKASTHTLRLRRFALSLPGFADSLR